MKKSYSNVVLRIRVDTSTNLDSESVSTLPQISTVRRNEVDVREPPIFKIKLNQSVISLKIFIGVVSRDAQKICEYDKKYTIEFESPERIVDHINPDERWMYIQSIYL